MPAATITNTAIDWAKTYVDAPDAFYHRALAHLALVADPHAGTVPGQLDIYNLQGKKMKSYFLTVSEMTVDGDEVRAPVTPQGLEKDAGSIIVRPDKSCSCLGYRRTPK